MKAFAQVRGGGGTGRTGGTAPRGNILTRAGNAVRGAVANVINRVRGR